MQGTKAVVMRKHSVWYRVIDEWVSIQDCRGVLDVPAHRCGEGGADRQRIRRPRRRGHRETGGYYGCDVWKRRRAWCELIWQEHGAGIHDTRRERTDERT
jgi:hypothetical protein